MKLKTSLPFIFLVILVASGCATTGVQPRSSVDTVFVAVGSPENAEVGSTEAGRFDTGKMWTFDNPPASYFHDEYGFTPDHAWFTKARTGALRLSNCSASFVSPNGLVLTNHHCARVAVTRVTRRNEDLATNGFYASSLEDERRVRDFYADQLVSITDVTDQIVTAGSAGTTEQERESLRQAAIQEVQKQLLESAGGENSDHYVQIISFYSGSLYSAYTFKRYNDVRLVQVPEMALGYFGGDADNFTYPRYSLDMSFFRVYDGGRPLHTPTYFKFSEEGSSEGDPVFVVGNPGTTHRLQTVSELMYRRDHGEPIQLRLFEGRAKVMEEFKVEEPREAQAIDLQNTIFSFENTIKARRGILKGLRDPVLMARKADAEAKFRAAIASNDSLKARYGGLFDEMASLQAEQAAFANQYGAYILNPSSTVYGGITKRATISYFYARAIAAGADPEQMAQAKQQIIDITPYPVGLEKKILTQRLDDLVFYLGANHADVVRILKGRSTAQAASEIVDGTTLLKSDGLSEAIDNFATSGDPAYDLGAVIGDGQISLQERLVRIGGRSAADFETARQGSLRRLWRDVPARRDVLASNRGRRRERLSLQRNDGATLYDPLWAV